MAEAVLLPHSAAGRVDVPEFVAESINSLSLFRISWTRLFSCAVSILYSTPLLPGKSKS